MKGYDKLFTVKNKYTGNDVDVVATKCEPIYVDGVLSDNLYFWVYNKDKEVWEKNSSTDYEMDTNAEVDFSTATVGNITDFNAALTNDIISTIVVTAPITLTDESLQINNVNNKVIKGMDLTVNLTVTPPSAPKYTLTVQSGEGGTINGSSSGEYEQGEQVPIECIADSGYTFDQWVSSNGGTFADSSNPSTSFTMPGNTTIVTANFETEASSIVNDEMPIELYGSGSLIPVGDDNHRALTLIRCNNLIFEDCKVTLNINGSNVWESAYVVQAYECNNIILDTATITGGNDSILCNDTINLVLKGSISLIGATFGGIELSVGSTAGLYPQPSILLDSSLTSFTYNLQSFTDRPIIYTDNQNGSITNNSNYALTRYIDNAKMQVKYFTI